MSLSGQFSTMALGDLLQWISLGQKTGTLKIEVADCKKSIYLRSGRVFFATSSKENERLGQFLIRHEHLDAQTLERCLQLRNADAAPKKLSEVIVHEGLMTEAQMRARLEGLVQEIIYDLFLYEDGYFGLIEDELPPEVTQAFQLDSQWLLFEGLRRLDEFRRNAKELPAADQVLIRTSAEAGSAAPLDKHAETLFGLVDGQRDLDTLLRLAPVSVYEAQIQVMGLLAKGYVTLKRMDSKELTERRMFRILQRGTARLNQGDISQAREMFRELSDFVEFHPDLHAFAMRLTRAVFAEVERLTGGLDHAIMVDPELLRGRRDEVLSADQGFILSRIGDRGSLREVLLTSGFSKVHTYNLMFSLLQLGLVHRIATGNQIAERYPHRPGPS